MTRAVACATLLMMAGCTHTTVVRDAHGCTIEQTTVLRQATATCDPELVDAGPISPGFSNVLSGLTGFLVGLIH